MCFIYFLRQVLRLSESHPDNSEVSKALDDSDIDTSELRGNNMSLPNSTLTAPQITKSTQEKTDVIVNKEEEKLIKKEKKEDKLVQAEVAETGGVSKQNYLIILKGISLC